MELNFDAIRISQSEQLQNDLEARELVEHLQKLAENMHDSKTSHVRKIENTIAGTDIPILSWRFNEWDYYSKKVKLPTYARGLFTSIDGTILCRGYDKFFNLNEMSSVKETELRDHTNGPYTITVKSNGCIVFISALQNGELIVCSKHSTGLRDDLSRNHAMAAQHALEKQLEKNGYTSKYFARILYEYSITAVCEFCDDSFEEHVLEYKEEKAGLYLHGLNFNTVKFKTYPMHKVQQFGKIFRFKETEYVEMDTFDDTLKFMNECNKTGKFEGQEIEGFVVRCFKHVEGIDQDFFFKYKFEEPYLLYREMREVTKQFLNNGPENLKFGKHKLICMDYLKFILPLIVGDEKLKTDYLDNKGIIELRKKYFESKNTTSMEMIKDELQMIDLEEEMKKIKFGDSKPNRYVLITVATIGCGKTTTSIGLNYLYPDLIDHVQNDNIQSPGKDRLVVAALDVLTRKPIVIIDKNNHKMAERTQIFDAFSRLNQDIPKSKLKFVCLNFLQSIPKQNNELWEITRERVISRGDEHQSIKVNRDGVNNAEKIMKGFISRFQMVNPTIEPDSKFDYVIDLEVNKEDSSLFNMKKIVQYLQSVVTDIDLKTPSEGDYLKAFEKAKTYKPTFNKQMSTTKRKPAYYSIQITDKDSFLKLIESFNIDFYSRLRELKRIQNEFHVTLMHSMMRRENSTNRLYWEKYTELFKDEIAQFTDTKVKIPDNMKCLLSQDYSADIELEKIVWDYRVMCVQVKILGFHHKNNVLELPYGNKYLHITIGTVDKSIPPVMAGVMLKELYEKNDNDKKKDIKVVDFPNKVTLKGLPFSVLMR